MSTVHAVRRNMNVVGLALAVLVAALPAESRADLLTYPCDFTSITYNQPANAQIGEDQIVMDVSADALIDEWVRFTFRNVGPEASSMTDVYFYELVSGTLSHFDPPAELTSSSGVVYAEGATPKDLPGFTVGSAARVFSADADAPRAPNGVNPDEWLSIKFNLLPGYTFGGVVDDLAAGSLVVGIKVQGFEYNNGSEGFVSNPLVPPVVPLPGAALLGSMGLGVAACHLRRRKELV